MKYSVYSPTEVYLIKTNLRSIESELGGPIPGGVIDVDDLKDRVLSPSEIMIQCHNLKQIVDYSHRTSFSHYRGVYSWKHIFSTVAILSGICFFVWLLELCTGWSLL